MFSFHGPIYRPIVIPRHTIVAGYFGFTLDARVSVRPSVRPSVRQSSVCLPVRLLFPDDSLSKHQWIFTKLGMCIDIVEIRLGIANGQISSMLGRIMAEYYSLTFLLYLVNRCHGAFSHLFNYSRHTTLKQRRVNLDQHLDFKSTSNLRCFNAHTVETTSSNLESTLSQRCVPARLSKHSFIDLSFEFNN